MEIFPAPQLAVLDRKTDVIGLESQCNFLLREVICVWFPECEWRISGKSGSKDRKSTRLNSSH